MSQYEHLIVRRPMNVSELPDHDLSEAIPFPVIMGSELVPEASMWAMYMFIKEITQELVDLMEQVGRATPHRHDFDEIYLMIGDPKAITFEVMLGDEHFRVETPGSVFIPRGLPHAIAPVEATVGLTGGLIPVVASGRYTTLPV